MNKKLFLSLGLALGVSAFASPSGLTVGGTGSPATLLATTNWQTADSATFNGSYIENVYSDPNNSFCAGCLDFVIQVSDNTPAPTGSSGIIERVTTSSFAGYSTSIGVDTVDATTLGLNAGTVGNPLVSPSTASQAADTVSWSFSPYLNPGQTSELLEIQTNATNFTSGFLSLQDGQTANGMGFEPTATPEPMSLGLIGGGLALIGVIYRRRAAGKV